VYFETTAEVTINSSGTATVSATAVEPGMAGNVGAGEISVLANPDPWLTAVTNALPASGGREKETDTEFRNRWDNSVATGAATLNSIKTS
jgi:uncharacterized phage protein gp47/JayE